MDRSFTLGLRSTRVRSFNSGSINPADLPLGRAAVWVCDEVTRQFLPSGAEPVLVLSRGEAAKNWDSVLKIIDAALSVPLGRDDLVGVDVHPIQRRDDASKLHQRFHAYSPLRRRASARAVCSGSMGSGGMSAALRGAAGARYVQEDADDHQREPPALNAARLIDGDGVGAGRAGQKEEPQHRP